MIPYRPEPLTDFRRPEEAGGLQSALEKVTARLGERYPLIIGGKQMWTQEAIRSVNPSNKDQDVGFVSKGDLSLAEEAVQSAHAAFSSWSQVSPEARAAVLFKAAGLLRRRKHEFSAWMMVEAGKNRMEADADTAEAIDFMEYYGRQMLRLERRGEEELYPLSGERNELTYIPLGVGVVITPWNFPLAILAGMTTAAVVAGNTVVLKPASATPVVAYHFVQLLAEAGLPAGVVNFLPGSGSEIGDYLVQHRKTRFISFTGSREVGVRMFELASKVPQGQVWLKRFVGELGGKDGIIVHSDADLQAAAKGIVASAFGFAGQKCSACSRAIVHEDVYDELLERCAELIASLKVGNAAEPDTDVGPVIDQSAYSKILSYMELGKQEGRLVAGGGVAQGNGFYLQPTLFADAEPDARIMLEEIFGPVLAFTKARDIEHALAIANNTEYGLTGSIYARDRAVIERAKKEFHVGNLYVNRKCTGALVGVHPFGGFNLSGTDSKAGGPDYLLLFTQPKLISELL